MIADMLGRILLYVGIMLTVVAYTAFIGSVIGIVYGVLTGELLSDLWN